MAPVIATSVLAGVTDPVLLNYNFINYQNVMLHAQLYFVFVFEARNLIFLFGVNGLLVLVLVLVLSKPWPNVPLQSTLQRFQRILWTIFLLTGSLTLSSLCVNNLL